jgi:hypothetical protein
MAARAREIEPRYVRRHRNQGISHETRTPRAVSLARTRRQQAQQRALARAEVFSPHGQRSSDRGRPERGASESAAAWHAVRRASRRCSSVVLPHRMCAARW